MAHIKKSWDDFVLFYGTHFLAILVCEGVIIYFTWEDISSLPYCVGLAITALVSGIAMHWALTKYAKAIVVAGYFVWFGIVLVVGLTAGILFMAHDREKKHDKAITQRIETAKAEAKIEQDKADKQVKNDLTAKLAVIDQLNGMLVGKNQRDRTGVLKLGQTMLTATPTPLPDVASRVEKAMEATNTPPKTDEKAPPPEEWHPFPAGTFFRVWHDDVTRLNGIIGLIGYAILLAAYLIKRNEEAALRRVAQGNVTTHTVTTPGPTHEVNSPSNPIPITLQPSSPNSTGSR